MALKSACRHYDGLGGGLKHPAFAAGVSAVHCEQTIPIHVGCLLVIHTPLVMVGAQISTCYMQLRARRGRLRLFQGKSLMLNMKQFVSPSRPDHRGSIQGFTLIELMAVLVILALIMAVIVPNVMGRLDRAKVDKARADVGVLMQALKIYKLDHGRYPQQEQGLQALVVRPAVGAVPTNWRPSIEKLPSDPWGNAYRYLNPGVRGDIDVFSLGADGQPGGEGDNADVGSWQ
jgi:general secretion pathway protein G